MHAGILSIPIVGRALKSPESLFMNRSMAGRPPLAVAQAKISNGDYLFRFRTGAFLTVQPIQLITIRSTHFLLFAGITPNGISRSDLDWFWRCFYCPGAVCHVAYLEPVTADRLVGKSPRERADMVQLIHGKTPRDTRNLPLES
jgi:hypothetical protein